MYISLVNHSHYSVLEGYGTVQEYIAKAKQLGMPALGLTDKGTAMGLFTFIKECNKNDVTPLPGLELFVRDEEDNEIYNLHLLATSNKGMRSITKLVSLSWLEENYNVKQERPTVLLQDLINYQEDLIVLSGNQDSQISTYITNEKYDKAIEIASRLKDVFKDNFYIELAIGTKNNLNKLVELAEELNIKTIITPGVYYTEKDEWEQHEVFLAINSKSKMEETPQRLGGKRKSLDSTSHWFMSEEEIRETVRQFNIPEEAYSNTFEIYEKIKNGNIRFINNPQLRPHVEVPEKYNSEFDYFKGLVKEGFLKKRGTASKDVQKESLKRIAYETDVLKSGNFISYFLTTADLVKESHREGHNTGLGRGSCGGSEVAYLLDIHETDPIKFDLMFDRFLSKGRFSIAKLTFDDGTEEEHMISDIIDGKYVHQIEKGDKLYNGSKTVTNYEIVHVGSSPDVDTDYHTQIRDDIINYSKEKYGVDKAANIITFNTMLAKGAFRDIAARYGIYPSDYNNISKAIPDSYRDPLSTLLDENNPDGEELRATLNRVRDKYINNALTDNEKKAVQEKFDKIIKFTDNLHNRIKSVGAHPAGVIISSVDLSEVVPVRTDPKDFKHVIEWEYPDCEYLGLIKWDFLGLNTINIIEGAIDNVNENYNVKLDMKDIIDNKLNDPKAINIFKTAQTETIFQYSGGGVKELLSNLRPDNFDEVAAVTAIFRPGPMSIGYHTSFVNRKNGTEELIPLHKEFEGTVIEEILEPTLNQLIYQEQVLQIAQRAAGFTATEADKFRRAIGKKDAEVMASMKIKFIEGIKNNLHVSDDALTTLWDGILGFSAYAFNKCLKYDTYVYLKDSSRITIKELYKRVVEQGEEVEILSMFDDGSIKPHKVSTVHDTGQQEIWTIVTENNKKIRLTANHRMLTTNGYGTIADGGLSVGTELIEDFYKKRYSDSEIERRKRQGPISASMMSPEARQKLSDKMKKYQSTLTFEDRSAHQQKIQRENPHRTDNWLKTGRERLRELEKDDEWVAKRNKNIREVLQARPKNYFGIPTEMDNGITADSKLEAEVGNFIMSLGFDFEFHKKFESKGYGKYSGSNRETDFYVDGLYIEVDGLRRGKKWFQERKYGDSIPFVVVDGDNYKEVLTNILNKEHIKNGTKIKEIIAPGEGTIPRESQTYDIEMVSEPRNFLANGLVSHNSHSISYALTAYVSAWLKAYYPAEYMASAIEAVSYNPKSFKPYISEAKRMGLEVLVPDINLGKVGATATKEGKILIGLCNIKGINTGQVKAILEERQKNGLFKDIYDFIERCHSIVSQGNLEKLIQAGAFDSLGYTRKGLILTLPELYKAVDSKDKISNSLFSLFEDANNDILRSVTISQDEYPYVEKLGYEAELLSNYLSGQPLSKVLTKTIEEQAYQNFKVYAPEKIFKTHCIVTEFKKVKSGAYYIEFTDGVNTFRSFTDDNVSQLIDNSLKKKNKNNLDLYQGTLLSTNRLDLKENNAYTFTLRNRSYNKNYYNKNSNEVQMVYRFDIINIEELYLDLLGNPIDIYTVTDDNYEEFIQMCNSMKNGAKRIGYKIEIPEQNIFLVKQYTTVDSVLYNREYSRDLSSKFGHYHVLDNYS